MTAPDKKLEVGDVVCCQEPFEMLYVVYVGKAYWLTTSGIERLRKFTDAIEASGRCNNWFIHDE